MRNRRVGITEFPQSLARITTKEPEQVGILLAGRLQEAQAIGDSLIEFGQRLKSEPWRWVIGRTAVEPSPGCVTMTVEHHIVAALDADRLKRLLDEIRWLLAEETRLLEDTT